MKLKKIFNLTSIILIVFFFALALWFLHNELKSVHYHQVADYMKSLPLFKILLAISATILSYFILTFYDFFAVKYVNKKIAYKDLMIPSFISTTFGQNIGSAILTSSSLRYRFYSILGFSTIETAKVILFCSLTFWVGFLFLGGIFFTFNPIIIPQKFNLPFKSVNIIGIISIILTLIYLLISLLKKKIKIHRIEISPPKISLSLTQIFISGVDLILSGLVLYFLLPNFTDISVIKFLSIYLIGIVISMISTVPGGIGVFESILLIFLKDQIDAVPLIGAVLTYRIIYLIAPLLIAMISLSIVEIYRKKHIIAKFTNIVQNFLPDIIPLILSGLLFASGVVLLFSGATPSELDRLTMLEKFVPLPFVEVSHFISSIIGINLLLIARGLQKKLDGAYFLSIVLLSLGIIFSLFKAFDYEEAIFLAITLLLIIPNHKLFYRKTSLTSEPFSPNWIIGILLIVVSATWLGFFSYKSVQYSHDLWWKFDFYHDAPRFLRSTVGIFFVLFIFGITRLIKHSHPKIVLISDDDIKKVIPIIKTCSETYSNLALLRDKNLLFDDNASGFIMYSIKNNIWAAMGDPVGNEKSKKELIKKFRELCDKHNGSPVFYEINKDYLSLYLDLGFAIIKYGEDARVKLDTFTLEGPERSKLRYAISVHQRENYTFEIIKKEDIIPYLPELKIISDAWLKSKNSREKKFSMGFFEESYLSHFDFAITKKAGKIVAFSNIWEGCENEEVSIDLMRYSIEANKGIMDYLFINLILWAKQQGYKYFNLGMAPLSGLEYSKYTTFWNKLGAAIFSNANDFYNFQGLRNYKDKFLPEWKSKYIAYTSGKLAFALTNITSLISSGFKGVISK